MHNAAVQRPRSTPGKQPDFLHTFEPRKHNELWGAHLMALVDKALRELVDVVLYSAKVGVEEVCGAAEWTWACANI